MFFFCEIFYPQQTTVTKEQINSLIQIISGCSAANTHYLNVNAATVKHKAADNNPLAYKRSELF